MAPNIGTKGTVNLVSGEGRPIPAKNIEVQVFEQDYFGPLFNLPLAPTLLGTKYTNERGEYEITYSKWSYATANFLDEDWVAFRPGELAGPGKPDIFVVVRIGGARYRFPPDREVKNVADSTVTINCDIKEDTPLYGGSVHDLYRFIEDHKMELSYLGGDIEEICDTIGDKIKDFIEGIADQLDERLGAGTARGLREIGERTNTLLDWIGHEARVRWEELCTHLLDRDDLEHIIVEFKSSRSIESVPQIKASTFNNCKINTPDGYDDSGIRTQYRLTDNGRVEYKLPDPDDWQLLNWQHGDEHENTVISYTNRRGKGESDKQGDGFDINSALAFDMLAADGNRVFVKEKGRDNFYFATLFDEFPKGCRKNNVDVPGFYLKLDPEDFQPNRNDKEDLGWWNEKYWDHPGMRGYGFMPYAKYGVKYILQQKLGIPIPDRDPTYPWTLLFLRHFRIFPDIMMVKVEPRLFHLIDSRPPYGSGTVLPGIPVYDHVKYQTVGFAGIRPEVLLPGIFRTVIGHIEAFQSIDFNTVQSIGVANAHRHIHYEEIYGGEICNGLDHVLVGPIYDRGGSCDGTCNFYILCRLNSDIRQEYAYGILWMDEQSYFSERWRLLSPADNKWGRLREWAMSGALKSLFTLETLHSFRDAFIEDQFWCPFKTKCIDHDSRMAVSRYTIAVAGYDPKIEQDEIYTIVYQWGGMDRTWRWRKLPKAKVSKVTSLPSGSLLNEALVLPQTISIRPDMTIHLKGSRTIGGETIPGRWYQRYLPADNWEVPLGTDLVNEQKPTHGYRHPWKFISEKSFQIADGYSHFGHYEPLVSSRSQYYPLSDIPEGFESNESCEWHENELSTKVLALDKVLDEPEKWIFNPQDWPGIWTQRPPSLFNKQNRLKIVNRGSRGWIAMHWDKRDDDLYPFNIPIGGKTIIVTHNGQSERIQIGSQKRKWSPPIVQAVLVKPIHREKKFEIYFSSMVPRKPRSLQEPNFDNIPALRELSNFLRSIFNDPENDPYIYHAQQQDWEVKEYPLPDATIWKVNLFVIDPEAGCSYKIKEWTIDEFIIEPYTFINRDYQFRTIWSPENDSDYRYDFNQLNQFFSLKGICEHGTSFTFEDITGHVAPPETIVKWFRQPDIPPIDFHP